MYISSRGLFLHELLGSPSLAKIAGAPPLDGGTSSWWVVVIEGLFQTVGFGVFLFLPYFFRVVLPRQGEAMNHLPEDSPHRWLRHCLEGAVVVLVTTEGLKGRQGLR